MVYGRDYDEYTGDEKECTLLPGLRICKDTHFVYLNSFSSTRSIAVLKSSINSSTSIDSLALSCNRIYVLYWASLFLLLKLSFGS